MSDEKTSLRTKVFDACVVTGVSTFVVALVTVAVAFAWDKVTTIDISVEQAVSKVRATQEVTASQLSSLSDRVAVLEAALAAHNAELEAAMVPQQQQQQQQHQQQQQPRLNRADVLDSYREAELREREQRKGTR